MENFSTETVLSEASHDPEVLLSWKWFMSLISSNEWNKRKANIEERITIKPKVGSPANVPLDKGTLLVINDDQIGWYLYLVEMWLYEPHKYELFQGARVIPIFKRFGLDFDLLMQINGIKKKVKNLIKVRKSEADALLFEILVALNWKKNGWDVSFLDESKTGKMPDLFAQKDENEYFIECKRQKKSSDYVYRETKKRQIMISHISKFLLLNNLLLDIVFHVELESLPDTYLLDLLKSRITSTKKTTKINLPGIIDISISSINLNEINDYLKEYLVRNRSPLYNFLIGKKNMDNLSFTSGSIATTFKNLDDDAGTEYLEEIKNAYGVVCKCDAPDAISAKARDIKGQLHAALKQFQPNQNVIVHIGMETFDGPEVERKRLDKIVNTMEELGVRGNDLEWMFLHFFQSYSTPQEVWVFDETVKAISNSLLETPCPLRSRFLVVGNETNIDNVEHWDRPLP